MSDGYEAKRAFRRAILETRGSELVRAQLMSRARSIVGRPIRNDVFTHAIRNLIAKWEQYGVAQRWERPDGVLMLRVLDRGRIADDLTRTGSEPLR